MSRLGVRGLIDGARDPRVAIAAILIGGLVLRLAAIGSHLSDAEGYSYLVSSAPSAGAFLHRLAAYENTPPLFYLLLAPLPVDHTAWLRVPAMIPGALIALVVYLAIRRPLGSRTALLAAAIVAVAPYHVSYSDYSRGFMLAGLGCMLALWAILRLVDGASWRWWLLYLAGGVVAVYSEYDAVIFLLALAISAAALAGRHRPRAALIGLLPPASLLPWMGQIERAQDALHHTKISPVFPGPSLSSLREVTIRLAVGEHGAGSSTAVRWLEFLVIVGLLAAAALVLRRHLASDARLPARRALLVVSGTAVLVLAGHGLAPLLGPELFNQRYLTALIPLLAIVLAAAVLASGSRRLSAAAVAAVAAAGIGVFAQRLHREYEPDLAPVRAAAATLAPRAILTNSAVVAYYLRGLNPIVDRPFGLGQGLGADAGRRCPAPCVIVDDTRAGEVRSGPGSTQTVGPFQIRRAHA